MAPSFAPISAVLCLLAVASDARYLQGNRKLVASDNAENGDRGLSGNNSGPPPLEEPDYDPALEGGDYIGEAPDDYDPALDGAEFGGVDPDDYDPDEYGANMISQQFAVDEHAHDNPLDLIEDGTFKLIGISLEVNSLTTKDETATYGENVLAHFCELDTSLNHKDPNQFPQFRDMASESRNCGEHPYTVSLQEVMFSIEMSTVPELPLGGLLYHQGHTGAGILSNAVAIMDSAYVVAEHEAVHMAVSACDQIHAQFMSDDCSLIKEEALIRDVFKLISRNTDPTKTAMFVKLDAHDTVHMAKLQRMFFDVPWTFSYDDAPTALSRNMEGRRSADCKRMGRSPTAALAKAAADKDVDLKTASAEAVCALNLDKMVEEVLKVNKATGTGMLVKYSNANVDSFENKVLPYFGFQMTEPSKKRLVEVTGKRSNTRYSQEVDNSWPPKNGKAEGDVDPLDVEPEVKNGVQAFKYKGKVEGGVDPLDVDPLDVEPEVKNGVQAFKIKLKEGKDTEDEEDTF